MESSTSTSLPTKCFMGTLELGSLRYFSPGYQSRFAPPGVEDAEWRRLLHPQGSFPREFGPSAAFPGGWTVRGSSCILGDGGVPRGERCGAVPAELFSGSGSDSRLSAPSSALRESWNLIPGLCGHPGDSLEG